MRLQHNIPPPLPGRGGNRKRKRDESVNPPPQENPEPSSSSVPPPADGVNPPNAFGTFKIEPQTPSSVPSDPGVDDYFSANGNHHSHHPSPPIRPGSPSASSDTSDTLPDHLLAALDPQTGLIMGRSPSMVKYLLMKAKQRYALEMHEGLIEELRVARREEAREREKKENALDDVLRASFG